MFSNVTFCSNVYIEINQNAYTILFNNEFYTFQQFYCILQGSIFTLKLKILFSLFITFSLFDDSKNQAICSKATYLHF